MPPVFIDGTSCTDGMLFTGQCVAAPIVKEISRSACRTGGPDSEIINIGTGEELSVKDGDTGINNLEITVTTDTSVFDFDGTTLSCPGGNRVPELGQHLLNLVATEDANQWRYSSIDAVFYEYEDFCVC